jgi:hypothetical protein
MREGGAGGAGEGERLSVAVSAERGAAALRRALFATPDLGAFAVVDGAARLDLAERLYDHPAPHACLFIGALDPEVAAVAPWLVELAPDAPIVDALLEGWGRSQGIFLLSRLPLSEVRRKLRTLTMAELPDRRSVFFRFYDPRVLRATAPLLDAAQRERFFARGGVSAYLFEGPEGQALRFDKDATEMRVLADGVAAR